MRLLFIGSKDRGVRCLNALCEAGHNIPAVITTTDTDPDAFWEGSVRETAEARDIPVHTPENINHSEVVKRLNTLDVRLTVMSGYNQVLGTGVLNVPSHGTINLHAGRLPEYRGGSPMNWAIINGETEATATIHYATEQIDAGDVIAEQSFPICEEDTIADVRDRTLNIFPELLIDTVADIENGTMEPRSQNISEGIYWASRKPQDGHIRWAHMTEKEVYDFVRALTHPYPGAFCNYQGERLFVWEASRMNRRVKHTPGRVLWTKDEGRVVTARDRALILKTVQPAGGEEQPAATFLEHGEFLL